MEAADQDLDAQATYISISQDEITGERFLRAVDETFEVLARHPRFGRVIRTSSRLLPELRILRIKGFPNFLVCYRLTKRGVEVLRVVHGARDYLQFFEE